MSAIYLKHRAYIIYIITLIIIIEIVSLNLIDGLGLKLINLRTIDGAR